MRQTIAPLFVAIFLIGIFSLPSIADASCRSQCQAEADRCKRGCNDSSACMIRCGFDVANCEHNCPDSLRGVHQEQQRQFQQQIQRERER